MKKTLLLLLTIMVVSCNANAQKKEKKQEVFPVVKTESQWRVRTHPNAVLCTSRGRNRESI